MLGVRIQKAGDYFTCFEFFQKHDSSLFVFQFLTLSCSSLRGSRGFLYSSCLQFLSLLSSFWVLASSALAKPSSKVVFSVPMSPWRDFELEIKFEENFYFTRFFQSASSHFKQISCYNRVLAVSDWATLLLNSQGSCLFGIYYQRKSRKKNRCCR